MKVRLNVPMLSLTGVPLKDRDEKNEVVEATVKMVIAKGLAGDGTPPKKAMDGLEKYKLYQIINKVLSDQEEIELTAEEISVIKYRVGEAFPPLVVGRIYDLLEGK